jgi:hypothetical protein
MESDGKSIETQSRFKKTKTLWRVDKAEGSPLFQQILAFWSLPVGTPLYVCRTARIKGKQKRILFRAKTGERDFLFWAEKIA